MPATRGGLVQPDRHTAEVARVLAQQVELPADLQELPGVLAGPPLLQPVERVLSNGDVPPVLTAPQLPALGPRHPAAAVVACCCNQHPVEGLLVDRHPLGKGEAGLLVVLGLVAGVPIRGEQARAVVQVIGLPDRRALGLLAQLDAALDLHPPGAVLPQVPVRPPGFLVSDLPLQFGGPLAQGLGHGPRRPGAGEQAADAGLPGLPLDVHDPGVDLHRRVLKGVHRLQHLAQVRLLEVFGGLLLPVAHVLQRHLHQELVVGEVAAAPDPDPWPRRAQHRGARWHVAARRAGLDELEGLGAGPHHADVLDPPAHGLDQQQVGAVVDQVHQQGPRLEALAVGPLERGAAQQLHHPVADQVAAIALELGAHAPVAQGLLALEAHGPVFELEGVAHVLANSRELHPPGEFVDHRRQRNRRDLCGVAELGDQWHGACIATRLSWVQPISAEQIIHSLCD